MTKEELAGKLDGNESRKEIDHELELEAKTSGLVVIFGASDDLMEFRGAINDECGAYDGTTALIDAEGLLPSRNEIDDDNELERFFQRRKTAKQVKAFWHDSGEYSWTYETDIPHATFVIMEDGTKYCRGIVISVKDLLEIKS